MDTYSIFEARYIREYLVLHGNINNKNSIKYKIHCNNDKLLILKVLIKKIIPLIAKANADTAVYFRKILKSSHY